MLELKPFETDKQSRENGQYGYEAFENGQVTGKCYFDIDEYKMFIRSLSCPGGDEETIEGLIRAALNFGGNRNVYMAYLECDYSKEVAVKLGFEQENGQVFSDIPSILAGGCKKGCALDKNR